MNHQNGSSSRRGPLAKRLQPDTPAVAVLERIVNKFQVVQPPEEIEQRITWRGNQQTVARVSEKPKDIRVGFAGARGQKDLFRGNLGAALGVIGGDGFPRNGKATRVRLVGESARVSERTEDLTRVVFKSATRGILIPSGRESVCRLYGVLQSPTSAGSAGGANRFGKQTCRKNAFAGACLARDSRGRHPPSAAGLQAATDWVGKGPFSTHVILIVTPSVDSFYAGTNNQNRGL